MVVGDSAKEAYTEFSRAAEERRVKGGESDSTGAKRVQRPPTNTDGAPPALTIVVNGAPNTGSQSTPWVLGSDVRSNNGIVSPAKPETLTATGLRHGDALTRHGTTRVGNAESGGMLSRAGTLSPPRESPSRGMSIARSPSSVSPLRSAGARGSPDPAQVDGLYDDLLDDYGDGGPPRRRPTMAGAGSTRALSTRAPPSAFSAGGVNGLRGVQRQRTMASSYSRSPRVSIYDEDGEVPLRVIKVKVSHARAATAATVSPGPLTGTTLRSCIAKETSEGWQCLLMSPWRSSLTSWPQSLA